MLFPRVSSLHYNTIYIFGYNTSEETRLKKTCEISKSYHIAGIYVIFPLRCTRLHRTCYKLISSFLMCRNIICIFSSIISSLHVHWTTLNTRVVYILLQDENSKTQKSSLKAHVNANGYFTLSSELFNSFNCSLSCISGPKIMIRSEFPVQSLNTHFLPHASPNTELFVLKISSGKLTQFIG